MTHGIISTFSLLPRNKWFAKGESTSLKIALGSFRWLSQNGRINFTTFFVGHGPSAVVGGCFLEAPLLSLLQLILDEVEQRVEGLAGRWDVCLVVRVVHIPEVGFGAVVTAVHVGGFEGSQVFLNRLVNNSLWLFPISQS